jgi:MoxR-like ATPase
VAAEKGASRDDWLIYRGTGDPHDGIRDLPEPPPWRRFNRPPGGTEQARTYQIGAAEVDVVNAALRLRRPLLVTGKPGTGKTSLADSIAHELKLGTVLRWSITSRSILADGLYSYDAIGRLQEAGLRAGQVKGDMDVGRYIRLGSLGTALLPQDRPRVLLIDELDKSDIDLPNDLLSVCEEGGFGIRELERLPEEQAAVDVFTADPGRRTQVHHGRVSCRAFPVIVITSNGEREFPPSFLRRCLQLDLKQPGREKLAAIVTAHMGPDALARSEPLIDAFLDLADRGDVATDQLLNAVYLATSGQQTPEELREKLSEVLLRPLSVAGP